jgi:MFS family permease
VDSLILLLQSIIAAQAALELQPSYPKALTIAVYVGMLLGAVFWGLGADIIGRRYAFNISLFICSISGICAGAAPTWNSLAFFIAMIGFGGGGNLILDTTVFLEYLPSNKQWVLTWLATWWGLGGTIAGLIAWPLMCKTPLRLYIMECILTLIYSGGQPELPRSQKLPALHV